ncbi:P-loop containing nucleoside triphosphate hydrolase protein [Phlebopus sp. FC_14]|nr:P-loop containing nucleoside triphosphate hydrolase protein [Phlebopus sp. FC_14]
MSIRNRFSKLGSPNKESAKAVKPTFTEFTLGIWRVRIANNSRSKVPSFGLGIIHTHVPLLRQAFLDVYAVSPPLFMGAVLTNLWDAIERPLSLYFSNRLLFFIERSIVAGDGRSARELYWAVLARVMCIVLSTLAQWITRRFIDIYKTRVNYSFEGRLYAAQVGLDLPTYEENSNDLVDEGSAFTCLESTFCLLRSTLSFVLQLRLISHIICSSRVFVEEDLWGKAFIAEAINTFYLRKKALRRLADGDFKPEVTGGGLSNYISEVSDILSEYRKAAHGLHNTPDKHVESLFRDQSNPLSGLFFRLCSDGPTFYFAFLALVAPSKLSLVQLAILQQTSISLRHTFSFIELGAKLFPGELARVADLYRMINLENKMKDGETVFPRPGYKQSPGMSIEFHTKSGRPALTDVSLTIKPGQLVVIVGVNGSGKSTIIKLLSRYYDVTSGTILVDGIPIQEYRMQELRRGIAILTQDHQLFPLSMRENIGLGAPEEQNTNAMNEAARLAGADGVIENFKDKFETVLNPVSRTYISPRGHGNSELEEMRKAIEKPASVSGGERQRLVAARTFMRVLCSSSIKLISVDEPSSALDPAGEYQLFSRLREARQGRTMIFVTHRFGHLTKHADLIVCMKDGAVVETGTHQELLAQAGQYAHLYNVQAQAFTGAA